MNGHAQYEPHRYARRILVCVTGLSPQVVTETLYALAVRREPRFVPTEVHLITTQEGAHRARLLLLHPSDGRFHRLCSDYGLSGIHFPDSNIHVLRSADGKPLSDIRTEEENAATADRIVDIVRRLTADSDSAVHASIAGGRKTMGFYLGYALSLYGRPQDRLSHVLVPPAFESHSDFFYPTPESRIVTVGEDNRPEDTQQAEVTLADIPFVRLREGLDARLLEGEASYTEAVAAAQSAIGPPHLIIDLFGKRIIAGSREVHVPPAQLALLSWIARVQVEGRGPIHCPKDGFPDPGYAEAYLREYAEIGDAEASGTADRLREEGGMTKQFFEQHKSRLHRILRKTLGRAMARFYEIHGFGGRRRHYRLDLPDEAIEWME